MIHKYSKHGDTEEERKFIEKDIEAKRKQLKKLEDGYKREQVGIDDLTDKIKSLESKDLKTHKEHYEQMVKEHESAEQQLNKTKL